MASVSEDWIEDVPDEDDPYWDLVRGVAHGIGSDGCSKVKDYYLDSCFEHDIHWRTGRTVYGECISIGQLNKRFRLVIQKRSRFGRFSPMSWWRWLGVSLNARLSPPVQCQEDA